MEVLILILLEVTQIKVDDTYINHNWNVLILILLEVTQIFDEDGNEIRTMGLNPYSTGSNSNKFLGMKKRKIWCLNPYSTGSNSNIILRCYEAIRARVLILILLEVTQIPFSFATTRKKAGLNPYSTGSNSNNNTIDLITILNVLILILLEVTQIEKGHEERYRAFGLNPYSTGSNSNTLIINNLFFTLCFVYFS